MSESIEQSKARAYDEARKEVEGLRAEVARLRAAALPEDAPESAMRRYADATYGRPGTWDRLQDDQREEIRREFRDVIAALRGNS